jgi:hypothetical protein
LSTGVKTGRNRAQSGSEAPVEVLTGKSAGPAFAPVERRAIDSLKPYERNARLHDEQQLADLRRSMVEFGWTIPMLIDEADGVLAGHARLMVGKELGYTDAPVIVARGWSEAQKRAYILADNKLTERGGWNWELVTAELKDIRDLGVDLALTGFEAHELQPLLEAVWQQAGRRNEASGDAPHRSTDGKRLIVTAEQFERIQQGIERLRAESGQPRMSEGVALVMMAERVE